MVRGDGGLINVPVGGVGGEAFDPSQTLTLTNPGTGLVVEGDSVMQSALYAVDEIIFADGTSMTTASSGGGGGGGENLSQTLAIGNSAGSYTIDMNSQKITNVATPTNSGDGVNIDYVLTQSEATSGNALGQAQAYTDTASGNLASYIDVRDQWVYDNVPKGITWNEVTGTSQGMSVGNGYIANNASRVTLTLPSTCAVGSIVASIGKGAGGWKIAQNSGQQIHFINVSTTSGTSGYVQSTNQYDGCEIICITANTTFAIRNSVGTLEVN